MLGGRMIAKGEWGDTVDETTLSRRRLMRALGGAGGLAVAMTAGGVAATTTDPTPEPDPGADPEASAAAETAGAREGTPVGSAGKATSYSGRNENLVCALIAEFAAATGIA